MGQEAGMRRYWIEEEKTLLEEHHRASYADLQRMFPDRTLGAILSKIYKSGLHRPHSYYYSENETGFLIKNYRRMTAKEIARKLGRDVRSILGKAHTLGIRKKSPNWTEEEDELVRKIYPTGSRRELLENLSRRKLLAIAARAKKLGVYRSPPLGRVPKLSLRETEKAWLACAIDCEGSIGIGYTDKRRNYVPFISINNTKKDFLVHFKELVGNENLAVRLSHRGESDRRKDIYAFNVNGMPLVYALLKEIRSYLIIKRKQADLVIEFIEIHNELRRDYRQHGRLVYTHRQDEIYKQLKELNKKGKK